VFLNDGRTTIYRHNRCRVDHCHRECQQGISGLYRPEADKTNPRDLSLLAGSKLKLNVIATSDLKSGSLKLSGSEEELPMALDPAQPRRLTGEFVVPLKGINGFSIQMLDTENMESRDPAVYRIDIIPDRPPTVKLLIRKRKEELVTRQAMMIVGIDALDDFAIAKARLRYKWIRSITARRRRSSSISKAKTRNGSAAAMNGSSVIFDLLCRKEAPSSIGSKSKIITTRRVRNYRH